MDEFMKKGKLKIYLPDDSGTLLNEEYMKFLKRLQSKENADKVKVNKEEV